MPLWFVSANHGAALISPVDAAAPLCVLCECVICAASLTHNHSRHFFIPDDVHGLVHFTPWCLSFYICATQHTIPMRHNVYALFSRHGARAQRRARNSHMLTAALMPLRENCRRSFFFDLIIWRALAFEPPYIKSPAAHYSHLHVRFCVKESERCVLQQALSLYIFSLKADGVLLNWFLHHQKEEEHLYCGVHTQYIGAVCALFPWDLGWVECENVCGKCERCCAAEHSHKLCPKQLISFSIGDILNYLGVES